MRTVVTNLMAREIILELMEENHSIRTAEDVADYLLKEKDNETIFTDGWEGTVSLEPFDWSILEEEDE